LEERVLRGICVLWTPSHVESDKQDQDVQGSEESHETTVPQELQLAGHTAGALLGVDLGLDAEEIDQPSVVDVLQPQAMLEDTLEVPSQGESPTDQEVSIKLKTEEIDDAFALQGTDELINQSVASAEGKDSKANITGLKSTSRNPILGTKANSNSSSNNGDSDTPATSTRSSLKQVYSPLRERLMESEIDQLFLDLDDFHITLPSENQDDSMELGLPPADLSIIFPELQTLSLSDIVTPSIPVSEGKKKAEKRSDRDDPSKRTEDTTYTKLFPIGQFMHTKPTLIGPLQPSKNWRDGKWLPLDEPPIHVDYDGPTRPPENYMSGAKNSIKL
jgi:chromatin modification-related protein VID21